MDVQCERCRTEYEFDDALVSGRGTTVRCTNCGHQFKVRRPDAADGAGDRWVVQTATGQRLTFLTLRELQRAILAKQVARHDFLLLGDSPGRPLGSIDELGPFFDGRASNRPPAGDQGGPSFRAPPPPPVPTRRTTQSYGAPPNAGPFLPAVTPEPPFVEAARPAPTFSTREEPPVSFEASQVQLPPPTVPVRRIDTGLDDDLQDVAGGYPPPSSDAYSYPRRRRVGGWIVAFVLLLAVGVVGWVLAKPYIVARSAASGPHLDPRTTSFLTEGEKAMSEGDLDAAQQDFDKASVLLERDPRVLLDEARVAAAKADVLWLKLRLLPSEVSDEARTTKAQLDERLARVRSTADDAASVAPDDPAVVRAKVDSLRLLGDRAAARVLISKVSGLASVPETAYVLAALDLAEPEPFWTTVIERLRLAAAAEGNAGRARAALVYALARSGDAAGAKAELAKLDALPRPYPCSPSLHAFVEKTPPKGSVDAGALAASARLGSGSAAAAQAPSPAAVAASPASTGPASTGGETAPGEQATTMQAASQAIKKGDYPRARRVYEALIARNPSDSEALSGLGDVDRAQGDSHAAIAAYKRALGVNPSYMPAMLGVADTEWASGDHASAQRAYKEIADRFPEGTYPSYVKARSEPAAPAGGAPGQAAASPKTPDPGDGI